MRDAISDELLKMQETNVLAILKLKWWKMKGGGVCEAAEDSGGGEEEEARALTVQSIAGVFILLLAGIVLGALVCVGELCWTTYRYARIAHVSFASELRTFLSFALRCDTRSSKTRMHLSGIRARRHILPRRSLLPTLDAMLNQFLADGVVSSSPPVHGDGTAAGFGKWEKSTEV